jgi:hypothetical protein
MRRVRILGTWAIAVLAVSAQLVASASAKTSPEWAECLKVKGGSYEKGCAKEGGRGGYVLVGGLTTGRSFTAKDKQQVNLKVVGGEGVSAITCKSMKEEGERAMPNLLQNVRITFEGCGSCIHEEPQKFNPKYIESEPLSGELGYISRSPLKVGLKLQNAAEPGAAPFPKIRCGAGAVLWSGTLNGEATGDVNVSNKKADFAYVSGAYMGEVQAGYIPLTNPPFEGEAAGLLRAETKEGTCCSGFGPPGGLPAGLEAMLELKGAAVLIKA